MASVLLVLDSDPEIARKIGALGQFALFSTTKGEAEDWLEKKGAVVSRVLINARLSNPAGLPMLRKVLETNPQVSVWLMVDKLEPWSKAVCHKLGYQGVFSRTEVKKNINRWIVGEGSERLPADKNSPVVESFDAEEMFPVLPFQLDHSDPLRFSLYREVDGAYLRIYSAGEVVDFQELAQLSDLSFYVVKEAVMSHLMLVEEAELRILENSDDGWQHQLAEWVDWPIMSSRS